MIIESHGNILESRAQAIVNTVNCVGVMGKGLALQFKRAYPENFRAYRLACDSGSVQLGSMFVFATNSLDGPQWIINFPTKNHWRNPSQLEYIRSGLQDLTRVIRDLGITSIAIPPLGAGNGGLNWSEVKPIIEESLSKLDHLDVELYSPSATKFPLQGLDIPMTWGREVINRLTVGYLNQRVQSDPWVQANSITELEIQKIVYFADRLEPQLALSYSRGIYGPYSDKLRAVLSAMEGTYLEGIGDGTSLVTNLEPILVTERAFEALDQSSSDTTRRISPLVDRVLKIVENFESPFGVELLASVDWVVRTGHVTTPDAAHREIANWTSRKASLFSTTDVATAFDHLQQSGLLDAQVPA